MTEAAVSARRAISAEIGHLNRVIQTNNWSLKSGRPSTGDRHALQRQVRIRTLHRARLQQMLDLPRPS